MKFCRRCYKPITSGEFCDNCQKKREQSIKEIKTQDKLIENLVAIHGIHGLGQVRIFLLLQYDKNIEWFEIDEFVYQNFHNSYLKKYGFNVAVPNLFFHPFDIHPDWTYIEKVRDHNVILVRKDFYNKLNNFEINYSLCNKLRMPDIDDFDKNATGSLIFALENFYEWKNLEIKTKEKTNGFL